MRTTKLMRASESRIIEVDGIVIECRVDEILIPSVLRAFTGATPLDAEVDSLAIPERPRWLSASIRALRWYRSRVASRLGQRCVFDPSCSRYAELALRERGVIQGFSLALRRLWRCRPGFGGVDFLDSMQRRGDEVHD